MKAASTSYHPLGTRAKVLLSSVFGPYAQDDEYGSRTINPMELYQNQVTRVQGAFSGLSETISPTQRLSSAGMSPNFIWKKCRGTSIGKYRQRRYDTTHLEAGLAYKPAPVLACADKIL